MTHGAVTGPRIAVVGSGVMGAAIALVLARAGSPVALYDPVPEALEAALGPAKSTAVIWKPKSDVPVSGEEAAKLVKLIDNLDDDDDVQNVFGNYAIDDAEMERLAGSSNVFGGPGGDLRPERNSTIPAQIIRQPTPVGTPPKISATRGSSFAQTNPPAAMPRNTAINPAEPRTAATMPLLSPMSW